MKDRHTEAEVAQTIKDMFKKQQIALNEFASKNKVTPAQLYNILNGKAYINARWALTFNMELGVSICYCMFGTLPIIDPDHKFMKLLSAATAYKEAVELLDRLCEEYEKRKDNLTPEENAAFTKAIEEARRNKVRESAELAVILKEGWNEDGEDEEEHVSPIVMPRMKLHEAIDFVIKEAGRPLSFTEIAKRINAEHLYGRGDGKPVPASQISARVKNYPTWFTVNHEESPATVSTIKNS